MTPQQKEIINLKAEVELLRKQLAEVKQELYECEMNAEANSPMYNQGSDWD